MSREDIASLMHPPRLYMLINLDTSEMPSTDYRKKKLLLLPLANDEYGSMFFPLFSGDSAFSLEITLSSVLLLLRYACIRGFLSLCKSILHFSSPSNWIRRQKPLWEFIYGVHGESEREKNCKPLIYDSCDFLRSFLSHRCSLSPSRFHVFFLRFYWNY